jgi:hypothetical protein
MKKLLLLSFSLVIAFITNAQIVTEIKPAEDGKIGEYGEWKSVDATFEDGTTARIEYRVRLATRKGIACHYDLEVKNSSSVKVQIKAKSSYSDKLTKSLYSDETKEKLGPGKSIEMRFVAQGCKKDKGVERDEYGHCMACYFGISLYAYNK